MNLGLRIAELAHREKAQGVKSIVQSARSTGQRKFCLDKQDGLS